MPYIGDKVQTILRAYDFFVHKKSFYITTSAMHVLRYRPYVICLEPNDNEAQRIVRLSDGQSEQVGLLRMRPSGDGRNHP